MDGRGGSIWLRDREISPELIAHSRGDCDILRLLDQTPRLDRKPLLDPNIPHVNNRRRVDGGNGHVSRKSDYQQGQTEGYKFEVRS